MDAYTAWVKSVVNEEPPGEAIGGIVFWVVLAALIGVIVWSVIRINHRKRAAAPAPSTPGGPGTRSEDYREHHTVHWSTPPASFTATAEHWPLAVTEVFGICGSDAWDRLKLVNLDEARSGLQESWGIRSRAQLLSEIYTILYRGQRLGLKITVDLAQGLRPEDLIPHIRQMEKDATEGARENAWRLRQAQSNVRGIRDVNLDAWDLVRAAMLCRAGYALGWLSEDEARDTLALICGELQVTYEGWADLGEQFMTARWFWGGGDTAESAKDDAHDVSRLQALLDPATGPWAIVPWEMPLPTSKLLLVDALVSEQIVVQLPDEPAPTTLGTLLDEAIAARLAERS